MAAHICRTLISRGGEKAIPFGDIPLADVRTTDIEALRDSRRATLLQHDRERQERTERLARGESTSDLPPPSTEIPRSHFGEIGINRNLELIRRLLNWAITKGLYERENPFHRFGKSIIKMARQQPRTRRLQPGEEERLLAAAGLHLRHVIVAAIDTGCRRGELLALQWLHVTFNEAGEMKAFKLPPEITKTDRGRSVPISPRLRAILQLRRLDPDGRPHVSEAYIFGDPCGRRIADVKLAWKGACQRAGIEDLRLHDLRREAASRLLEHGVDLMTVSMLLGHQKTTTTDTYLRGREDILQKQLQDYHDRRAAKGPSV